MADGSVLPPGANPDYSKGTYVPIFPNKERNSRWPGRIADTSDKVLTVGITPLANCIVGKYHMYVAVVTPYGIRRTRKEPSRDLYILFNPWAPGLLDHSILFWTKPVCFAVIKML